MWYVRGKQEQDNKSADPFFYNIHLCHHDSVFHGPFKRRWTASIALWFARMLGSGITEFYLSQDGAKHRLLTPGGDDYWQWLEGYEKVRHKWLRD